jgi:hypothetical protein
LRSRCGGGGGSVVRHREAGAEEAGEALLDIAKPVRRRGTSLKHTVCGDFKSVKCPEQGLYLQKYTHIPPHLLSQEAVAHQSQSSKLEGNQIGGIRHRQRVTAFDEVRQRTTGSAAMRQYGGGGEGLA